ncbi:hypothetical protein BSK64_06175 [Paenibacillus odorifer]|uniref:hypothetical protein n=1 Tax=Paenibacillus odorifer TaxID=189426 RepID=UPI00096EFD9A|nr:hypothetical protein [Paenibacillus odorifer]OME07841.1 hypothetical protein BSK64_06175 [Paenibacillus odorifer]
MWDQFIELPFVKSLGWGWIIPIISGLLPLILKLQPVTALTSTKLEQILLSKEKRLSLRIAEYIFHSLLISIVSSSSFFAFYGIYNIPFVLSHQKIIDFSMNSLAILFIVTLIILMLVSILKWKPKVKFFNWLFGTKNKQINWIMGTLILFFIASFTLIPNSLASGVVRGNIKFDGTNQVIAFTVIFVIAMFIFCLCFFGFAKHISTLVFSKFRRYSGKTFYFLEKKDGYSIKWYIYHPVDKVKYLLGDTALPEEAKLFKFIEKKELLEKEIHVYNIRSLN